MRHLSADRLAALADEAPTAEERAHLAACAACCAEREAHRRVTELAAADFARAAAPLGDWGALSARLAAEGLIRTPERVEDDDASQGAPRRLADPDVLPFTRPVASAVAPKARRVPAWVTRAAAAVALVSAGVLGGRVSAVGVPVVVATRTDSGATDHARPGLRTVGNTGLVDTASSFRSTQEAVIALDAAERTYQRAMAYLAMHDTTLGRTGEDPTRAYRARLAALDEAIAATQAAMKQAPYDPVINRYYLQSASMREATLRQLDDALPVSERVTRF